MSSLRLTLITCRDIFQWPTKHQGEQAYQKRSAVVRLSPQDMKALGLKEGDQVRLSNSSDKIVVRARSDQGCPPGLAVMPVSAYANRLTSYEVERGLPNFKGLQIEVETTEEPLSILREE